MSLIYIFIIAIVLITTIGFIVKFLINRKSKNPPNETKENSNYPGIADNNYFIDQKNETIDYITRIDSQKFKIVMLPSLEDPRTTKQAENNHTTNRTKNNTNKIEIKPDTLDFHLSENPEQIHQLLLAHPHVELLKKEILKNNNSLFNLDNLILLIIRTINIKLKSTNDTISYPQLILEVKYYLSRGNLLLENLDAATSTQSDFKSSHT